MPLYVLSKEHHFDEIILERRLNIIAFTVCWSLGSKMIFPTIFDLSTDQNLTHVNFYRIDTDENNLELTQRLNIVSRIYFLSNLFYFVDIYIDKNPYYSVVFSWK